MTKECTIRMITASDAELLSGLAITLYNQHYPHLWHDNGAWYTGHSYNIQKLRQELSDLNNFHYIAWSDEQPVGYLKLRINANWKGLDGQSCLEVERIYILKEFTGSGTGKKLMNVAIEIAKYHNQQTVFLKAMDTSLDAIAFYQKMGFEVFDTLTLVYEQMKPEYRGMVVMIKLN